MMIQLQKYNIQLVCKPGREMYRVDILSRAYLEIRETETVSEEIEAINMRGLFLNIQLQCGRKVFFGSYLVAML
jgi:hypothetical protein